MLFCVCCWLLWLCCYSGAKQCSNSVLNKLLQLRFCYLIRQLKTLILIRRLQGISKQVGRKFWWGEKRKSLNNNYSYSSSLVNPFKMTESLSLLLNPRLYWKEPVGRLGLVTIAGDLFPRAAEVETSVQPSSKSTWSCPGSRPLALAILSLFTCILTCFPEWKKTKEEL